MRLVVLGGLLAVSFSALSVINYRTVAESIHDEILSSSLPLLQENLYTEIVHRKKGDRPIRGEFGPEWYVESQVWCEPPTCKH